MTAGPAQRFALATWPTPLGRLNRIEHVFGLGPLLVKRDDLAGFGCAGNKTRPLEYLIGAALAEGCDVVVTGGRPDSNFCPATAAAASAAGLDCHLVMASPDGTPTARTVNMHLALAAGARLHDVRASGAEIDECIFAHAATLLAEGRRPYAMPRGGSTAVGAMGFADAAHELYTQLADLGVTPAAVVCAVGSGGTYAGLLAGVAELDQPWPVIGASVSRPLPEITQKVLALVQRCAELRGAVAPKRPMLKIVDAIGHGHGRLTAAQGELADAALRDGGLLLDSTYTAKSFELAVNQARLAAGAVVFWHTGGIVGALERVALSGAATHG